MYGSRRAWGWDSPALLDHLKAYADGREARDGIGLWMNFYNRAPEHPSVYVVEEKRLC